MPHPSAATAGTFMPHWLWGAVAIGAICGWLCRMFYAPAHHRTRAQIIILAAMILLAATLYAAFGFKAALGFVISASVFCFFHAAWHRAFGPSGSI
jgi:ABC-type uncharacterized transport system permease subunit